MNQLPVIVIDGVFSLCRLAPGDAVPSWALPSSFYTISKTSDELSVVCESLYVPVEVKQDGNWRLLKIASVLNLSLTGITAKFSTALANVRYKPLRNCYLRNRLHFSKTGKITTGYNSFATCRFPCTTIKFYNEL